jgi:hypothetical protein
MVPLYGRIGFIQGFTGYLFLNRPVFRFFDVAKLYWGVEHLPRVLYFKRIIMVLCN